MLDLDTLVSPLGAHQFLEGPWPGEAWWAESGPERVASLAEIPELEDPEKVLAGATGILAFRPDGTLAAVPNGQAAMKLYQFGLTCYLPNTRHVPALQEIADSLTRELGMPQLSMHCEIFCSSGDSGAKMHADLDVNFALLVRGRKQWTFAPNRHIRNQTGLCVPSTREAPSAMQLKLADVTPFPAEMPEEATVVEVADGGVVFLPRGWWHETEASGDCMQVNFVINQPMWLRVLSQAVENHLVADPDWRGYAYDVFAENGRREAAFAHLVEMVPELRARLARLVDGDDGTVARRILDTSGVKPID
jgi:hypothetical protein